VYRQLLGCSTVSEKVSLIATGEHAGYAHLRQKFPHKFVRHAVGQYVDGVVHTQTIDGFWSLLKRGTMGTFHKVSASIYHCTRVSLQQPGKQRHFRRCHSAVLRRKKSRRKRKRSQQN
jgi:hypothetical protein